VSSAEGTADSSTHCARDIHVGAPSAASASEASIDVATSPLAAYSRDSQNTIARHITSATNPNVQKRLSKVTPYSGSSRNG
jgi:hypothetical protein